ncbi:MAG: hypothetical protein C6P37_02105 [Caldibacillus debilis]|uniref:Uncharacterized protein n=1 Tax=Caldibacillus debilis TaxID=301148 RepID=A0A3E0K7Y7_9BACI|nr:hypothetical protein [Bacillaceae bacterium]REJ18981.1 MAG: hypothetical protein C6W57_02630 [Caldibacillus debilis]REJ30844.1 MAG: hypothetical protein C6P37_02105 [Caldibacillus debilis]
MRPSLCRRSAFRRHGKPPFLPGNASEKDFPSLRGRGAADRAPETGSPFAGLRLNPEKKAGVPPADFFPDL